MLLKPVNIDVLEYPSEICYLMQGARIYDSSCSPQAKVIFIDKDSGYFLKTAAKGSLEREAVMTKYFHKKGLSANVIEYISGEKCDLLLTDKARGDDCTATKYLEQPKLLCDTLAERLALLHAMDFADCPIQNHTEFLIAEAEKNKRHGLFDKDISDYWDCGDAEKAWTVAEKYSHLLKPDTLLHGDYCMPNIILDDWRFSGFIDLDFGGVGDRHVDMFWGIWSLWINLKTHKYRERFIDAYGRDKVDEDMLKIVAAVAVFG